ncbi:hypothetical protein LCGC14_1636160 [marine sediment metagenome]|uniref:Uncharacterized protein n=1 Tax=marine sediment metagenome TaxID=412755 RepID=A0A0F9I162_9ZZZZ
MSDRVKRLAKRWEVLDQQGMSSQDHARFFANAVADELDMMSTDEHEAAEAVIDVANQLRAQATGEAQEPTT